MDKQKKLQKLAKLAKILEQGSPAIARFIFDLEDKLEQAVTELSSVISSVSQQTSDRDNELKKEFEDIKPTDERLVEIIRPLIPEVKDGLTPSEEDLLALIKPLIPQVENGKTPSKEDLLLLIKPLIPEIDTDKIIAEAVAIVESRIKLPSLDKVEKRVDNLNKDLASFKEETDSNIEQLQDDIDDLSKQERTIVNKYYGGAGGCANKFTELIDTFNDYSGLGGRGLRVKPTEDGIDTYIPVDTDEKVKLNASDPTAGYLDAKLQEGIQAVKFDIENTPITSAPGLIQWNAVDGTYDMGLLNSSILQVGQETMFYGKASGAIANGDLCQFAGVQGDHILIKKAVGSEIESNPNYLVGVATENIANGSFGYITWFGKINGVYTNTPNNQDTVNWVAGDLLYFNLATGQMTNIRPVAPNRVVSIGAVIKAQTGSSESGVIAVRPIFGNKLTDLDDVNGTELTADGQIITWHNDEKYFDFDKNINDYLTTATAGTTYAKLDGTNQPFKPTVDTTTRYQFKASDDLTVLNVDTTNKRIGIRTSTLAPISPLHIMSPVGSAQITLQNDAAAVVANNKLGAIDFRVSDNNRTVGTEPILGSIELYASQTHSATAGGTYMTFKTGQTNTITNTERMRIDQAGNVGIGTTSPADILTVSGTTYGAGKSLKVIGATYSVIKMFNTDANASARNWALAAPLSAYGNFEIRDSTALGGDPISAGRSRLRIDPDNIIMLGNIRLEDNTTDATTKYSRFSQSHYTNAEESITYFNSRSTATTNDVYFGGGVGGTNAATSLSFYTAPNNTTLVGTERLRVESDGNVFLTTDSQKLLLGAGKDMSVYYDGTSGNIKTNEIAASDLHIACGTDKTVVLDETVWADVDFPILIRTTGTGIPTLTTFNGNLTMPQWAVNDFNQCESQEFIHEWKEGSECFWHIHYTTNGLDATDRYVKFELEYAYSVNGVWTFPAVFTTPDLLIPANTPDKKQMIMNITSFTPTNSKIGDHVVARLKRVTATGTAPTNNPWIPMLQIHIEKNTLGSRQIGTK